VNRQHAALFKKSRGYDLKEIIVVVAIGRDLDVSVAGAVGETLADARRQGVCASVEIVIVHHGRHRRRCLPWLEQRQQQRQWITALRVMILLVVFVARRVVCRVAAFVLFFFLLLLTDLPLFF
jgi:hypothetical protein